MKYSIYCKTYEMDRVTVVTHEIIPNRRECFLFLDGRCQVEVWWKDCENVSGKAMGEIEISFTEDSHESISLGLEVLTEGWKRENYVFAPGAVYDGNRFESRVLAYPPFCHFSSEEVLDASSVIADIPHLDLWENKSEISFLSGDMSTPAMGFFREEEKNGCLLFGNHVQGREYTGFTIQEDIKGQTMRLCLCLPGVREGQKYFFGERADGSGFYPDAHTPSEERGSYFTAGQTCKLSFTCFRFAAENRESFFRFFNQNRCCMEKGRTDVHTVPFHTAYLAIKEKYQRENYIEEKDGGYFAVGTRRDIPQQCWQAGWIGGGMNNLAFLLEDEGEAFLRGLHTFWFILDYLQKESGWIAGIYAAGKVYGDAFETEAGGNILLVRKNADLLYFLLKELRIVKEKGRVRREDEGKIMALCDAFVRLFRRYGQLGQFLDIETEELKVAGSASAAIAAGALALAYEAFAVEEYLITAKALGDYFAKRYLHRGILNGGPGEICQAPDSEAAFGLLESYVQLYETTDEERWLLLAQEACELAITWVMSYDFAFPEESTAAKNKVHSVGSVFANAQNKHSAPGICTLSGNSILKLYRFTGEEKYLDWLQAIAHSIPQFVSLRERPIAALGGAYLPEGYMNERVQTSDWEGKETVGEFLYGSNWPEVSMMLTYVEVPGIYIDISARVVKIFDHILCLRVDWAPDEVTLELRNPTSYDTQVLMLMDDRKDQRKITHNYYGQMKKICLKAGECSSFQVQTFEKIKGVVY